MEPREQSIRGTGAASRAAALECAPIAAVLSAPTAEARTSNWCAAPRPRGVTTGQDGDHFHRDHRGPRTHLLATRRRSAGAVKGRRRRRAQRARPRRHRRPLASCVRAQTPSGGVHRRRTRDAPSGRQWAQAKNRPQATGWVPGDRRSRWSWYPRSPAVTLVAPILTGGLFGSLPAVVSRACRPRLPTLTT